MYKQFSALVGIILILIGTLALTSTLGLPIVGLSMWPFWSLGLWRLWPLAVVGVGLLFVLPPFLPVLLAPRSLPHRHKSEQLGPDGTDHAQVMHGRRGLGGLFIPGIPLLTTGAILLFASVFNWWRVWKWLWPQEVLALALGFLFAAIYARRIWLIIPATIIGLNGIILQFCTLTGLWEAWAVLWTVEPLAVGLSLLAVGAKKRSAGLFVAGLILVGLAGAGLIGMTLILSEWKLVGLLGAAVLILVGFLLLVSGLIRRPLSPSST